MRLALPATLLLSLVLAVPALAQAPRPAAPVVPVMLASATAAVRAPRAPARLFTRVEAGITPRWPAALADFSDYAAQEIEAGSVAGDLYVRWTAFDLHARSFAVDVAIAGRPFVVAATVEAGDADGEYGVHLLGLAPGLYEVRMREASADGTETVSAPLRIRI
ncbi:MAG TPA: hypothetical protein VGB53_00660 [Rubricoccaceae bacterium]|jgi:hypothetical protein